MRKGRKCPGEELGDDFLGAQREGGPGGTLGHRAGLGEWWTVGLRALEADPRPAASVTVWPVCPTALLSLLFGPSARL